MTWRRTYSLEASRSRVPAISRNSSILLQFIQNTPEISSYQTTHIYINPTISSLTPRVNSYIHKHINSCLPIYYYYNSTNQSSMAIMSNTQTITFMMLTTMLFMMISFSTKTNALSLIPYNRPLWDMMIQSEDPFKILEQNPLNTLEAINLARADWKETSTHHVISLDVPGMKRADIKIEVEENRVLKVSGERKAEEEEEGDKWHRAERTSGKFWRQFRLPGNADVDNIMARLEDGVLKIKVPKLDQVKKQAKIIDIMSHDELR
ncbi:putative small heat shock protein HSP20 [Helianthus anomalus]